MPQPNENERVIATLIESYRLGFLNLNPGQLASIWDSGYHPLIYVAQEKEAPIYGWPAIGDYFSALPQHLDKVLKKELDNVHINVSGNMAITFFNSRSSVLIKGSHTPYEPGSRVSMIFHRAAAGWLVIHYHESAQSAQSAGQIARMKSGRT